VNIQKYSLALLTSFERNKSTTAIAHEAGENQIAASRFLDKISISGPDFMPMVKELFGDKKINLVIDDFVLSRRYANNTEAVSSMKDQSTKTFTTGTSLLVCGITDSEYFLPLDLEQWIAEFIAEKGYLSKPELAERLIERVLKLGLKIDYCVLDGLYFSVKLLNFLNDKMLKFVIKAKTTTSVVLNGQKMQLKNCPDLRLNSNQNCKRIEAEWSSKMWHFVAVRRRGKHGTKIIYLIANFLVQKTKLYKKVYDSRWTVEKFIRTGKQKIGLNGSQSQQAKIYLNHIRCVFIAYGILQFIMKKFRLESAEDALRKIQAQKMKSSFVDIVDQFSLLVKLA